jgi:hypothetical protein
MRVYIYECRNCQRVYPRTEGKLLACPFCGSKERNELGNGFNAIELIDQLINLTSPTLLRETLKMLEYGQKEQDNG